MNHVHLQGEWPEYDPPPDVPTIEEIELADALRQELELRYLGRRGLAVDAGLPTESARRTTAGG